MTFRLPGGLPPLANLNRQSTGLDFQLRKFILLKQQQSTDECYYSGLREFSDDLISLLQNIFIAIGQDFFALLIIDFTSASCPVTLVR